MHRLIQFNKIALCSNYRNQLLNKIRLNEFKLEYTIFEQNRKIFVNSFALTDKKNSANSKSLQNIQKTNESDKQYQNPKFEESPVRKLLRVKDFVDLLVFIFLGTGLYIGYKKYKSQTENEKKLNIEWLSLPNLKHKLFKCNNFYLPEFTLKNLEKFKELEVRNDDVWIISFPKSGTTWVQELVYVMINNCDFEKAKKDSIENRSPFLDYPSPGLKYINEMKSTRIIKTHLPISFLPENIENKSKVIYIARNPKDVSVSYYHFIKLSTQAEFNGNFDDFVKLFIEGKVPYGPWWSHVDDYANRKNVHLIYYEDLIEKPVEVIKSLSKFLGKDLTESQINSIIEWCSFDNMKKNPSVNYEWYKTLGLYKKDGSFFRKGKIGDWLVHYSKEDSLNLDKEIDKNLKLKHKFNYGISEDDLIKVYNFKQEK